ncbi:MAG TPA: dihydrodipicolinate synthase family protein [Puia sp.]|nr:dihydrodipicolinate synthase family protein [Puia sp.]
MKTAKLEGLIAAPFTPMNADGSINVILIREYYAFLKRNGITGAFICGSTGEGASLSLTEKKRVAAAWAEATRNDGSFKVMLLVSGNSLAEGKELALYAREIGLYAISLSAPSYFKPADVGTLAVVCREVASVVGDMPFYYYHIPVLTGVPFTMYELLAAIGDTIPNFAGIKYTHEDFMDFMTCLHFRNGRYDMLWGRDENMLPALAVGARGAVGSTFNYAAPLYTHLISAYERGDLACARQWQQRSINMIRLLGKYGGIATGKAFMKLIGLDCGAFRLPVKNMSDAQFEQFKKDVSALDFDAFKSV